MAKLTESYLRSMIKQVMNESMDESDKIAKLIKAMNKIRTNYSSMNLGSSVPQYFIQGQDSSFNIKDFINNNVSGQDIDKYLNELTELLSAEKVRFSTDDYSDDGYLTSIDFD